MLVHVGTEIPHQRKLLAGYGYLRPHVRLFDPGWRGPLVTQQSNGLVADYGNDPVGLIARWGTTLMHVQRAHCHAVASSAWSRNPSYPLDLVAVLLQSQCCPLNFAVCTMCGRKAC